MMINYDHKIKRLTLMKIYDYISRNQYRRIIMNLLNENLNYEVEFRFFIDELDRFDEFDLECISRDYDERTVSNFVMKDVDETFELMS